MVMMMMMMMMMMVCQVDSSVPAAYFHRSQLLIALADACVMTSVLPPPGLPQRLHDALTADGGAADFLEHLFEYLETTSSHLRPESASVRRQLWRERVCCASVWCRCCCRCACAPRSTIVFCILHRCPCQLHLLLSANSRKYHAVVTSLRRPPPPPPVARSASAATASTPTSRRRDEPSDVEVSDESDDANDNDDDDFGSEDGSVHSASGAESDDSGIEELEPCRPRVPLTKRPIASRESSSEEASSELSDSEDSDDSDDSA